MKHIRTVIFLIFCLHVFLTGLAAPGIAAGFGALTPVSLHVAATAATTHLAVAASLGGEHKLTYVIKF